MPSLRPIYSLRLVFGEQHQAHFGHYLSDGRLLLGGQLIDTGHVLSRDDERVPLRYVELIRDRDGVVRFDQDAVALDGAEGARTQAMMVRHRSL